MFALNVSGVFDVVVLGHGVGVRCPTSYRKPLFLGCFLSQFSHDRFVRFRMGSKDQKC